MPGTTGTPNADTVPFAAILSPMVWIAVTGGPMNVAPADAKAVGEISVLRKKSVTGMHGLRAAADCRINDDRDVEVAVSRRRRPDRNGDVCRSDMARVGVRVAVHRDRPDAHGLERADHPDGDLTPVGDQNGVEHSSHSHPEDAVGDRLNRRMGPAESARPTTVLVSTGSITPSSQSRAVE